MKKIFRITQWENMEEEGCWSAIVIANTEEEARNMNPWTGEKIFDWGYTKPGSAVSDIYDSGWCTSPDLVEVQEIGTARIDMPYGVILRSLNG